MLKSSLLEIIRTFTKQELIKFEDFVRSPYFNKKENVAKLYVEIKNYAPAFTDANLEKEKIWAKVFPEKEYNYGIMKNLIFDLYGLAETFAVDLKFRKDRLKYDEYVLDMSLERGLNKSFKIKYNSIFRRVSVYPEGLGNYSINEYCDFMTRILNLKNNYVLVSETEKWSYELYFVRDSFFITRLLVTLLGAYNDVLVMHNSFNTDERENPVSKFLEVVSPGIESIIESIGKYSELNSSYLRIHYLLYLSLNEKTEQRYYDLKKIVFNNLDILPYSDKLDLHTCLLNAIYNVKSTSVILEKEIIEIMESQVSHNVILLPESKRIPLIIFTKYIVNAFFLNDAQRIKLFSNQFIDKLDPQFTENMKTLVNFLISFINKNYDDALSYLSLIAVPYQTLKIDLKPYKAMCLYEINNYEMFLNEFDNLKHFNRNNEFINDSYKNMLIRFYTFVDRLYIQRLTFDRYGLKRLKNDLEDFDKNKVWFSEKIEEIEKANLNI
ncbi:MAG: hypothetical protein IPM96_09970 [Ignavibacteria bacterium]|nr:hypothetical protein [Ignavibacteria bacterium]